MIQLLITVHVHTHTLAFGDDREFAERELNGLLAELNKDRWSRNDKEGRSYAVKCPTGEVIVVLEHVSAARIIDTDIDDRIFNEHNRKRRDEAEAADIRHRLALKEAGLLHLTK